MTRKSQRRLEIDFSNTLPNHVFPEDIPVLIRKTAEDLAGAYHDEQIEACFGSPVPAERIRSKQFRARWRSSKVYVKLNWATFVPMARTILTGMLEMPDVSLAQKEAIYEAFLQAASDKRMLDFSEHLGGTQ